MIHSTHLKIKQGIVWVLILVVVITQFFVFSEQNKKRILEQNENYVQDNAVQTAQQIDEILLRSLEDVKTMSYWFGQTLESPEVTVEDLKELSKNAHFDYIRYTDSDGQNLTADDRTSDATDREYFLEGIAGKSGISVTMRSRITSETLVNFYTPLRYKGEIIGVLRGVYLADKRMKDLLHASFFGEGASSFLCDSNGKVIAGNSVEFAKIPKNITEYIKTIDYIDEDQEDKILNAFETGEGTGFSFDTKNGVGNGYVTRLESNDWFLIQTFPAKITGMMYEEANSAGIVLEVTLIIMFLCYILYMLISNRKQKKKLLDENRDMNYVIHGIPQLYDRFVLIDLETDDYRYMLGQEPTHMAIPRVGKYSVLEQYILENVRDEDEKQKMKSFLDPENIRKGLAGKNKDIRFDFSSINGREEWLRVNFVCVERKAGTPVKVLLARQDISEEKNEEIEKRNVLRKAMQLAEESSKAKSTFLFNMSHDIRTPINAIIGFANMAEKKIGDEKMVRNYIHKIQNSSMILLKLINDILDLARIESGKTMIHPALKSLQSVAERIRDMFSESMQNAGITFSVECDLQEPFVMCDDLRMNQIAINLVNNAQKFTPTGGSVLFRIEQVSTNKEGLAEYKMVVKDNGIGMSEEFLPKIFESFERERTSTDSGIQGTGLGLSIVKKLVDMMGGIIQVKSKLGEGTEITICFTFKVVSGENIEGTEIVTEETVDFAGKRLLLVEDNELNREIACEILREEGFEIDEAADGVIAVEMVRKAPAGYYDLILMDIQMPRMNGYEAARTIRSMKGDERSEIPIIAMTANAFEEDKKAALDAGMNDHIGKPIDIKTLNHTLKKVFESFVR